jgi:hypothetical protein
MIRMQLPITTYLRIKRFVPIVSFPLGLLLLFVWLAPLQITVGVFCDRSTGPFVPLQNSGDLPMVLTGWKLSDRYGSSTLPSFILMPGATVRVWSGTEQDYPAQKPHYWLAGIQGSGPFRDTITFADLYANRDRSEWSWQGDGPVLQAPYGAILQFRPVFHAVNCDLAFSSPQGEPITWHISGQNAQALAE